MLTRCPICKTTFRITPDQLKARNGQVRCGQCLAEFNSLETLVDDSTVAASPSAPLAEPPVAPATQEPQGIWESIRASLPESPGQFSVSPEDAPDAAAEPLVVTGESANAVVPPAPEPSEPSTLHPQTLLSIDPDPPTATPTAPRTPHQAELHDRQVEQYAEEPFLQEDEPRRRWPWVVATMAASLLLAAQAALHFRVELATRAPKTRPALVAACEVLGCQLSLPAEIAQIGIEASDLHPDNQTAGHLQLVATLRNRAPYAQAWPHLELTLTDSGDRALVRRAIAPTEYLAAKPIAGEGFGAHGEQPIQLDLQAPGVPAVGYRLYVFYP